jgi:hypothetical protein
LVDGDTDSNWYNGYPIIPGYWVHVDLGTAADVKGVLVQHAGSDYPESFDVQVSDNGAVWFDAASGVTGAATNDVSFATTEVGVRFVRIVARAGAATPANWWTISELNVTF